MEAEMRERTAGPIRTRTSHHVIALSRRLLGRTALRRLPLTRRVHEAVFRFGCSVDGSKVIANYRGLRLTGPDLAAVHQFFGGGYEEVQISLFERLAATSRVAYDVGANIGVYTCVGAARLPPDGRMIAFEPVPENARYLTENLKLNGLDARATVEAAAVGEESGQVTIYLSRKIGHHSAASANAHGSTLGISVPLVSLDAYTRSAGLEPPDIIKIDVQGYDGFVLRGARDILRYARPALFVEYAPLHLENCGFGRADFLDLVFSSYPHVFLLHKNKVRRCTKEDVLGMTDTAFFHVDLLAVARQEHLSIIRTWCSEVGIE
jgi:FkbM family methyltransferase